MFGTGYYRLDSLPPVSPAPLCQGHRQHPSPPNRRKSEFGHDGTVNKDISACVGGDFVFRDEGSVELLRAYCEQIFEGDTHRAFVRDVLIGILLQRVVIVSDRFMCGF